MARRILLTIEYDGTAYSGWQRQYNGLAVQQLIEEALRQARLSDGIRCSALTAYPAAVRTRAVKLLLGEIHASKLSERHIRAVDRLLFSECPSARVSLPGGFSAQREYDRLLLTAGSPAAFEPGNPPFFSRSGSVFAANGKKIFQKFKIHSPLLP